ncbi:MAG: hypothetical protein ACR2GZ_07205 [Solirubrobacteraceae bacterium]
MSRVTRIACLTAVLACTWVGLAQADGPAGADPHSNFTIRFLPAACNLPASAACVGAALTDLDAARTNLGQPPYLLPANFTSLTPEEQGFVLANLDRILYGLAPIPGLTAGLSRDAAAGAQRDTDPKPSDASFNYYTSNWAGGFANLPLAYEAWMYDDGAGSGNLDCTSSSPAGCWGHRHDILWRFDGTDPLAMGVAVGTDPAGSPGFAMLLGEGDSGYRPAYTYTWSQAVAAGANGGASGARPAPPGPGSGGPTPTPRPATTLAWSKGTPTGGAAAVTILSIRVYRHRVSVRMAAPTMRTLRCALARRTAHGWPSARYRACPRSTVFGHVRRGRYRLRVLTTAAWATRYLRVS